MSPAQHSPARLFIPLLVLLFLPKGGLMLRLYYILPQDTSVWMGAAADATNFPANARDMDALVKAADTAMYSAKQSKDCFRFFPAPDARPEA
jgi:hypothetical protein